MTLIEILAVMACILILSSLLLPQISRLRDGSRAVGCLASLRSLSAAAQMFATDNNNEIVTSTYDSQTQGLKDIWVYRLSDYVLDHEGWTITCPAGPYAKGRQVVPYRVPMANYGMNADLCMTLDSATGSIVKPSVPSLGRVLRYSDLASLHGTILFFDSGSFSLNSRNGWDPGRSWFYVPGSSFNKTIADFYAPNVKVTADAHQGRHGGTINFARADGSCGTAQAEDFATNPAYWNIKLNN